MSKQPQPPARIYARWVPEVGEWDLWDEHYGHDDEAHVYVPVEQRDELFEALLFARSAILCGDEWTDTCERVINGAIQKRRREQRWRVI